MWFFMWSSWCRHKAKVNFHPKSAVVNMNRRRGMFFSVRAYQVGTLPTGQYVFPKKNVKNELSFFLAKKRTQLDVFSVNFTVRQDLLIRRSLYLHPFFWTTQYGMVLQQIFRHSTKSRQKFRNLMGRSNSSSVNDSNDEGVWTLWWAGWQAGQGVRLSEGRHFTQIWIATQSFGRVIVI